MLRYYRRDSNRNRVIAGIAAILSAPSISTLVFAGESVTQTPIKHLIVFIGENRSFDHLFATYEPKHGQSVANLLSKGIILKSGQSGPHSILSQQYQINHPYPSTYFIDALVTKGKTLYQRSPLTPTFPVPNTAYVPSAAGGLSQGQAPFDPSLVPNSELPTIEPSLEKSDLGLLRTGASGLAMFSNDTRVANATTLPNGVFQITGPTLPYDSYHGRHGAPLLPHVAAVGLQRAERHDE